MSCNFEKNIYTIQNYLGCKLTYLDYSKSLYSANLAQARVWFLIQLSKSKYRYIFFGILLCVVQGLTCKWFFFAQCTNHSTHILIYFLLIEKKGRLQTIKITVKLSKQFKMWVTNLSHCLARDVILFLN